jgi:hypothetical protein
MYLRVYDNRDSSHQSAPSPSLYYSLTHAHRTIGYHNRNPQPLVESATRLLYLRVYDSRDSSHQSAPSPSLCYSLTQAVLSDSALCRNAILHRHTATPIQSPLFLYSMVATATLSLSFRVMLREHGTGSGKSCNNRSRQQLQALNRRATSRHLV